MKKIIKEGETWIGSFNRETFNKLLSTVTSAKGRCSFALNGKDFTIIPYGRGFMLTSGTDYRYEAFNIESALKAAWRFSNGIIEGKTYSKKLHNILMESISKLTNEWIDAEPYENNDAYDMDDYQSALKKYTKMPKGYDKDIDDDETADAVAMLNKNYESEAFPYVKERQRNASWNALRGKNARRKPIRQILQEPYLTDNRRGAKAYIDGIVGEDYKPLGAKYSEEHISNVQEKLLRQVANLMKFMNAYSDTILSNGIIEEHEFDELYGMLTEINSKH